ncbi:DUF2474 domain-containing protein [Acinetobacter sp. LoGeW2-3]|nr:DUF2474 domain-containing protein [Acinetobacter sp. LoGeW2-3]ATO18385.1 DUF2474 domain-containing protein [Acinetobacter sp. LoGeW2-3]
MKLNRAGWFIVLWLAGFLTMAIIAGFFRFLLQLAY